jgi:hypothetical protein
MMNFIRRLFESKSDRFIKHLIEMERETPNNYEFGSLLRFKLNDYKKGKINLIKDSKYLNQ